MVINVFISIFQIMICISFLHMKTGFILPLFYTDSYCIFNDTLPIFNTENPKLHN